MEKSAFVAQVTSPLTGSTRVTIEETIGCEWLIENYLRELQVDVSPYFRGLKEITQCRCLDTGYQFYYPYHVAGDGQFYEALQKWPWYYANWKWEYEMVSAAILPGDRILEVGCGRGKFIERMQETGAECVGLELNEDAIREAGQRGLQVLGEPIQEHARKYPEKYDVVCAFQVLEHIPLVRMFIQGCLDALRPGGKLILSVPNNRAFFFRSDPIQILNRPPHHMGRWDVNSLLSLTHLYDLQLSSFQFEPVQEFGEYYQGLLSQQLIHRYGEAGEQLVREGDQIIKVIGSAIVTYLDGHTIVAEFSKKICGR